MRAWCEAPSDNACTAKEYKAFKNTQKSEWHENIILKFKTIEPINF